MLREYLEKQIGVGMAYEASELTKLLLVLPNVFKTCRLDHPVQLRTTGQHNLFG